MELLVALNAFIEQYRLSGNKFIVAVSGGKDSMALLNACIKLNLNVIAAHCNFKLRGEESDGDQQLVEEYCFNNSIPLETIAFDTKKVQQENKLSIQETARNLRYAWFEELRSQHNAQYIFTAHHQTDDTETFLLNLTRGSGLKGLAGIPQFNNEVARPLLNCSKSSIDEYVQENKVPYRNDSSNANVKYARNFIRKKILPLLIQQNAQAVAHIHQSIEYISLANQLVEQEAEKIYHQYISQNNDIITIDLVSFKQYPYFKLVGYLWLTSWGFSSTQINQILTQAHQTGAHWLSDSFTCFFVRGKLEISTIKNNPNPLEIKLNLEELQMQPYRFSFNEFALELIVITEHPTRFEKNALYLNANQIGDSALVFRIWKDSDKFKPLGMDGYKKVSDFFIDMKLTPAQKKAAIIVADNSGKIAGIIPYRPDEDFKVHADCNKILVIRF